MVVAGSARARRLAGLVDALAKAAANTHDIAHWGKVTTPFRPVLMGGTVEIGGDPKESFKIRNVARAGDAEDRQNGIPNPVIEHPEDPQRDARIALVSRTSGETYWLTVDELDRYVVVTEAGPGRHDSVGIPPVGGAEEAPLRRPTTAPKPLVGPDADAAITGYDDTTIRTMLPEDEVVPGVDTIVPGGKKPKPK